MLSERQLAAPHPPPHPPPHPHPTPQLKNFILQQGLATEADLKELEKGVTEEVEDCVEFSDKSPKPVGGAGWRGRGWRWVQGGFLGGGGRVRILRSQPLENVL